MKPGDVLILDCDTKFSNYIRRFTGSDWTHVALMGRDGKFMDYCINGRQKSSLEELIYDPSVNDKLIATPPPHVNVAKMLEEAESRYESSRYDYLCIVRLIPKLLNQRDEKNLHLFKRNFTCSSLIARSASLATNERLFPLEFHYSQTIPDDFATYWRTYRP